MMNLYVIGPITGIPNDNFPDFEHVRFTLWNEGKHNVDIPHDFVSGDLGWNEQMALSIGRMLLVDYRDRELYYDGVAMLDGWEESKGAKIEHDLAVSLGIPCKPWREWL